MVSIIKNQLLKHLSRYTKNLSADKINLSTFKGEGELTNLELDEMVLTELLELPTWLRLTNAWCNKVAFRIQWTKLKTVPIYLNLDEVLVEVETCEEFRSVSSQHGLSSYSMPTKYKFINKVVDGMTVFVNTVCVTFRSPAFVASVQISRILVESKSPSWQRSDLRMTRLKEPERGQLLIFKELEWQTVRIEAKSTKDENLTPLRLLTNQARCRITIKKRISDCFILGSRLVLILDDLLWVLTDSQLKAALCFVDSLADLVQKSTELSRVKKAARKIEELPEYRAQISQQERSKDSHPHMSRIFNRYDVVETSYHLLTQNIDLHLCDDAGGRSSHPELKDGAALQITLRHFQIDYYPYHLAIGDRKHWPKYRESASPHTQWLKQSLALFRNSFVELIDQVRTQHAPLGRSNAAPQSVHVEKPPTSAQNESHQKSTTTSHQAGNPIKYYVLKQLAKLMTSCTILRIQDFTLYQVTTSKRKQAPKEFISGDGERFNLPDEVTTLHAEFTHYYYPGDIPFPLPPPKFYIQINPVQVRFDVYSCLWLNAFLLNLHQSLMSTRPQQVSTLLYVDVKIEAIMPRIVFDSSVDHPNQKDRPKSLHILVSRASVTNIRNVEHSSRADLAKCVDAFQLGSLFYGADFPSLSGDYHVVTEKFLQHLTGNDNVRQTPVLNANTIPEIEQKLCRELLWIEAKDMWCINLEPVWADFLGIPALGVNKSVPFLDAFPLTLWIHVQLPENSVPTEDNEKQLKNSSSSFSASSTKQEQDQMNVGTENVKTANFHVLAHISNLVSVQLNHYQYLFLLRLSEEASELATILALDSYHIQQDQQSTSMVIGAVIPQVELTFVMPSQAPGKECSGADLESVLPDSSSLQEENIAANVPHESIASKDAELPTPGSEISSLSVDLPLDINSRTPDSTKQSPAPFTGINIPNNFNAGLSSMKKGFSSLMTSLDSALKPSPDDASDTVSLQCSDASSDSENYVMVDYSGEGDDKNAECLDAMFRVASVQNEPLQPLEVASEVVEEEGTNTTSPSDRSIDSSSRRRDLVSMSTFKLGQVEFVQQSEGLCSFIKVQVSSMCANECGSIPWDELQNKFGCRSRAWTELPVRSGSEAQVTARLTHIVEPGELITHSNVKEWANGNLEARVQNLELELNMSTVTGLTDLIEDEIIPVPLPMQISLENVKLHLIEDRPSTNITSPGPVPINLSLQKIFIKRKEDGIFCLEPLVAKGREAGVSPLQADTNTYQLELLEESNRQLLIENKELKRKLSSLERVSEENHLLRQSSQDSQVLRSFLAVAQDDVASLLEEKRSLLDRLKGLQDQLEQSHHSKR